MNKQKSATFLISDFPGKQWRRQDICKGGSKILKVKYTMKLANQNQKK